MAAELSSPMLPPVKWTISLPSSALQASSGCEARGWSIGAASIISSSVIRLASTSSSIRPSTPMTRSSAPERRSAIRLSFLPSHRWKHSSGRSWPSPAIALAAAGTTDGMTPTRTTDFPRVAASLMSTKAFSAVVSRRRACGRKAAPASVRATWCVLRSNRRRPIWSSTWRIAALSAGWETIIRSAARLKLADSARAVKNRSWRSEMAWVRAEGRGRAVVAKASVQVTIALLSHHNRDL